MGTMQMAALTYQSHIKAATTANLSLQALAQQQEQLHQTQHQIIKQLAALSINQSNAGQGIGRQGCGPPHSPALFAPNQFGRNNFGSRGGQGRGRGRGRGCGPPTFNVGCAPPLMSITQGGHQHFRDYTRRQAEDIIHPRPRRRPRTQTSQRGSPTGMRVTLVVLTWLITIPARHAPNI
jgi:hypothetical protein